MNPAKRFALLWCFSILVGLFKAFVLLNLWNWFVVDAFHVSPISFLPMLGVVWFIQLATASPNNDAGFLWKKMHALIGFCVPEEKRQLAEKALKEVDEAAWEDVCVGAGQQLFGSGTVLVLGFCVHLLA